MIRTILFDMGGTLDGEGHWLERFLSLYRSFGVNLPRETIRAAFDKAERKSSVDEAVASADLAQMIALHVKWQLTHLQLQDPELERHLVTGFIAPVRKAAEANTHLFSTLTERDFSLGVVSNGCGNVDKLCADLGYTPFLSIIVDSRRVGLFKPDPAIFRYASEKLGSDTGTTLMVGDSFERDIKPAKSIGMKTAWLGQVDAPECSDPLAVDLYLGSLTELPEALETLLTHV